MKKTIARKRSCETRSFGQFIRERRNQLNLTRDELARRIKASVLFIGRLEANQRRPSDATVTRLANALGLDRGELFFLANPEAQDPVQHRQAEASSAWEQFKRDQRVQRTHAISRREIEMLSQVTLMGDVRRRSDFVFILNTIRQLVSR